jgi:pimeloyl-ACP methyl ester carboxylesterase
VPTAIKAPRLAGAVPVALHHAEKGPAAGFPVVLVHGFPFDGRMWGASADALAAAGYRAIIPDLRGHGKSPPGDGAATMEAMADDVAALLDRIALRKVVLLGFSMGGYVALQFAQRHRERLRALALVDTRAEADSEEAKAGRRKTAADVRERGMQALVDALMPKLVRPATHTEKPQVVALLQRMILENPPDGAVAALAGMARRPDMRARIAGIGLPCLVVVGEEDAITPPEAATRLAQAFSASTYELVAGAAHCAPLERPERFHEVLLEWLGQVAPA